MIETKFTTWGIANNYGDLVEVHKDLVDYPTLFEPIIKHEFAHSDKKFSKEDLALDLRPSGLKWMELMKFMMKRPKTFVQLSPIVYCKNKHRWAVDINMSIVYLSIITVVGLASILWYTKVYLGILGGLIWFK